MEIANEAKITQPTENPDAPAKGLLQRIKGCFRFVICWLPFGATKSEKTEMVDSRDHGAWILSARDWKYLCDTLENPPEPSAYAIQEYERYKKNFG